MTTKKRLKYVALLILLFNTNIACAQFKIQYGIKAGSGTSIITFNEIDTQIDSFLIRLEENFKKDINAHFGLFIKAEKDKFFLQTELLYTYARGFVQGKYLIFGEPGGTWINGIGSQQSFMHINLPLLFGLNLEPFVFQLGPVYNNLTYKSEVYNYLQESNEKHSLGYLIGMEIYFNRLFFSARYCNYFTPIVKKAYIMGEEFDINLKAPQFMYSIGFILGEQGVNLKKKN